MQWRIEFFGGLLAILCFMAFTFFMFPGSVSVDGKTFTVTCYKLPPRFPKKQKDFLRLPNIDPTKFIHITPSPRCVVRVES